jgi:putative transposase
VYSVSKFRIWTSAKQAAVLAQMLETHRRLYNDCLAQRKTAYETEKRSVSYGQQSTWFKGERKVNVWYDGTNFSSAQATMRRLDRAFGAFFRRIKAGEKPGYPRFKGRGCFDTVEYPSHGDSIRLTGPKLRIQHVGVLRVKAHRAIEGAVKTLSLKREADKWYVLVVSDIGERPIVASGLPPVGIDVGLTKFLTTSDGGEESNPRYLKQALPELRRLGRSVARKKKGHRSRRKAVAKLRRCHVHVANQRREHHHQVALRLTRRYGFIAVEDLAVRNMVKNHRLARAIFDAGWSQFQNILRHKAERAGVVMVAVPPAYTTQECSQCGVVVPKLLSERWHSCPCGCELDRDVNAARVILARALARTGPEDRNVDVGLHDPKSCRL